MKIRFLTVAVLLAILVEGCTQTGLRRPLPTPVDQTQPHGSLSAEARRSADATCYGGMPVDRDPERGATEVIVRSGYVLEHSSDDKIPLWVCESVSSDQLDGALPRHDKFRVDPELVGSKSYPGDYTGSGYDRGHQAPAGNQTRSAQLKDQTFYMSNMAPQRPSLNRGIWRELEELTRTWAHRYGHAYEWTGPIRCGVLVRAAMPEQRECRRQTIGQHAVAVPLYFYKIVVVEVRGRSWAIAFVLPNVDYHCPCRLDPYRTSIESIERETGIEFMPHLSARDRQALTQSVAPMWP
jgi:endonuclease G